MLLLYRLLFYLCNILVHVWCTSYTRTCCVTVQYSVHSRDNFAWLVLLDNWGLLEKVYYETSSFREKSQSVLTSGFRHFRYRSMSMLSHGIVLYKTSCRISRLVTGSVSLEGDMTSIFIRTASIISRPKNVRQRGQVNLVTLTIENKISSQQHTCSSPNHCSVIRI